ncbi:MAG: hypothetical protein JSU82_15650 [Rhodospirillales bacterium]|nr:MAG: hypothetical protein JSU82_15650 [Rhodospirillales bacterium]
MIFSSFLRAAAWLIVWIARLAPAAAVGSLFFVFDGGLQWLGLFAVPLLLLALRRDGLGCGRRGCGLGDERAPGPWPAP